LRWIKKYLTRENLSREVLGRWVGLAGPYAFYPSKVSSVRDIFSDLSDEDQAHPVHYCFMAEMTRWFFLRTANNSHLPYQQQV
jgi:hypothetical protein